MSDLYDKLSVIKKEKADKILPNNIRKGVTIFGVEGTLQDAIELLTQEELDKAINTTELILGSSKPYTELDYIQSDGNQWINLNTTLNNNTKIEVKFKRISQIASSNEDAIIGSRNDTTSGYLLGFYSKGWLLYGTHQAYINKDITSNITTLRIDKNKVYEVTDDGATLLNTYNTSTFTTPTNAVLFAERQSNKITHKSAMQLYYFKLYNDNELILDLIPVLDISKVPCLYDTLTGDYYYNRGTGTFLTGTK